MITEIEIEGFKSLKHVKLKLGHLNLFVGTNASGKSNFLDALRILQGIGYGFTIDEIFNGKPKGAASIEWDGIRGGSLKAGHIVRQTKKQPEADQIKISVKGLIKTQERVDFFITINPKRGHVINEKLLIDGVLIYEGVSSEDINSPILSVNFYGVNNKQEITLEIDGTRPILGQSQSIGVTATLLFVPTKVARAKSLFRDVLSNMQRIDPNPALLRQYSQAKMIGRMGEHGENFASLIEAIIGNDKTRDAYLSWLKELTPTELDDVTVLHGALNEPLFTLRENGVDYPAPILSDGTLRFAALTAAFFQPDMPDIMTIEEIENGIHPTRLRLLVELLKTQVRERQVFATTHSPTVLAWLQEEDYKTTFFFKRDDETGETVVTPLNEIPRLVELAQKYPIDELFIEGWMETAS